MSDESTTVGTESEEREPEELDAGSTRTSATDLGDVTVHRLPEGLQRLVQTVGFEGDAVDYYRFELTESREVRMALQARSGEVELYLEDAVGEVLSRSMAFASYELVVRTLPAGTYYLRVLPAGTGGSEYEFKYGVFPADDAWRPWDPEPSLAERLGMPSFEESEYGFALAEHADGSLERVSLGVVSATDTNGDALHYALVGGNESGRFAIDAETGELFYTGPGEDHESGAGPHELTVRAGDGTHTVDATVTVTVTDVPEEPAFTQASYAFDLAENVDGSEARVALGKVTATDPDGDALRYALVGGNESGRFAIDAETGELYYVGPGEDHESGAGPHELTVRVSDGTHTDDDTHTVDATVTVTVTDVPEAPAFAQASYGFALAEHTDGSEARVALGAVTATDPDGDALHHALVGGNESGRFAIDAESGELFYAGPGEDYESGAGSHELTVRASDGELAAETAVTVTVTDVGNDSEPADGDLPADRTTSAVVRVDEGPVRGRIESTQDWDWFAVDLHGGRTYRVDYRGSSTGDGTLIDPVLMGVYDYSTERRMLPGTADNEGGTGHNSRAEFVAPHDGRYYIWLAGNGSERHGTGTYELEVRTVPAPVFGASSYAFALAESVDGSETRVALGTVQATDPDGDALRYRLVGGNESGLFAMDASSGELSYVGTGEDYESGAGPHELTVRASDGTHTDEATVTVTVTDAPEAPVFAASSYAFDLAENVDGSEVRVAIGAVSATDSDGDSVRYTLVGGNDAGLFAIDEASGELSYVGAGEDHESGAGPYELTVRASDGTHTVDATVMVTVVEHDPVSDKAADPQGTSEPTGEDLPAERSTKGKVLVDAEEVKGRLDSSSDRDWFQVTLAPGRTYEFDLEGDVPDGGTAPTIRSLRDSNGNPVPGIVGGTNVRYTTAETSAEGVYYVEVGGSGNPGQGTSTTRSFGALSIGVAPLGSNDSGSGYRLRANDITETRDATDDYASDTTTTGTAAVGGKAKGNIDSPGDRDWFSVTLEAGRYYRFDLEGSRTNHGTLGDPFLYGIYDSGGNRIAGTTDDDSGSGYNSRVLFRATEAGTYYVSAGAWKNRTGTYTLSVEEVIDDFPAGTGTTGRVAVGGSARGLIETPRDRDWFAVTLEAGKTYRFDLEGYWARAGTLRDPYLYGIYDSVGNPIAGTTDNNSGIAFNSLVEFTATEAGTYYVSAGAWIGRTGTYKLSVEDLTDDFTADTNTEGAVEVGGSVIGKAERHHDRDWFAVSLERGKTYRFDLEGASVDPGALPDPYLRGIYDAGGNLLPGTSDDDSGVGNSSRVYFKAPDSATYYVAAASGNKKVVASGHKKRGAYELSVVELVDDYADGTDTTGRVEIGGSAEGKAVLGDRDWFAVTLEAGKTYRFDLEGASTGAGTMPDPYLYGVHDADGSRIVDTTDDNSGIGANSRLYFSPSANGVYYVVAGDSGDEGGGTYRVSVTDATDDYSADTDTTGTVAVAATASGEIERPGDRDWFSVVLEAGTSYRIYQKGSLTSAGRLEEPYLRGIHDAEGTLLEGTTDDVGRWDHVSRVYFEPDTTGTYYIAAGADREHIGTYTLLVVVGPSPRGRFDYSGDGDWFAAVLESGKTYRVDQKGVPTGDGTLQHPHLHGIHDTYTLSVEEATDGM